MGKTFIYQAVIFLMITLLGCTQEKQPDHQDSENNSKDSTNTEKTSSDTVKITAKDFNNTLINYQRMAIDQMKKIYGKSPSKIDSKMDEVLFELKIYQQDINAIKKKTSFKNGPKFAESVLDFIQFFIDQLEHSLQKIIDQDLPKEKAQEKLLKFDEEFSKKEEKYFNAVDQQQKKFADYHNIKLVQPENESGQ